MQGIGNPNIIRPLYCSTLFNQFASWWEVWLRLIKIYTMRATALEWPLHKSLHFLTFSRLILLYIPINFYTWMKDKFRSTTSGNMRDDVNYVTVHNQTSKVKKQENWKNEAKGLEKLK